MIYLLQDCYKDLEGKYHDILKIGYSKVSFGESRKTQYDTHNYGYTLISEKEGSPELESYLHKRLRDYNISLEWFKYDPEVIRVFEETSEDDISDFTSQEELNEYIRNYILHNLVPTPKKLSDLYLEGLLRELEEKSKEYPDLEYNENLLKNEIFKVFKFVSSKEKEYFETLDFNSLEILELLSECGLDLPQISGKQGDKSNPFKNMINLFYRVKRNGEKQLTKNEFQEFQSSKRKSTEILLGLYQKANDLERDGYLQKLKLGVKVSNYKTDFIGISKITNQPVYNYLVDISNERAWEVSQCYYQDKTSITKKSLMEQGFGDSEYKSENYKIVPDFLDNHFYSTGLFQEKLRKEIYLTFQEGDRYSMRDTKQILQSIYTSLGITKKAKATDLGKYFNLTKTQVTLPDKTVVNGFKLGPL